MAQDGAEARAHALHGLVDDGVLTPSQATAVTEALRAAEDSGAGVRWTELVGFLGGGLVFAGAVALVSASWDDLTQVLRTTMLVAVSLVAAVGGLVAAGERLLGSATMTDARRRIAGTLFVLTACTAAMAMGVALEPDSFLAPTLVGLVLAVAGYAAAPTVVGLLACAVFSLWAVTSTWDFFGAWNSSLPYGLSVLALGLVWAVVALSGVLPNRRVGLGVGAALALLGVQVPLSDTDLAEVFYGLTLVVAALALLLYRWERSWILLVTGVIGVTLAVPEAIWDWTDGAIGGAAVILVAGVVLLAASGLGLLLHRERPSVESSDTTA
ncbi:DUF2157 domain-containing protein [Nocardiopsis ansamitocini]|uniref:DUF2157 domain-containing protein n=1 Tax=Nocardiopsis ansamitocini TaxID=1670832 RepID=A0A9W6P5E7_9ACTN|nr:DUF2157 domain-containing protein [Nocardiopsis ansamitocini]GLU47710.1 hypothetical protein Nans01_20610 [Nocardiopsis ansamitocini]